MRRFIYLLVVFTILNSCESNTSYTLTPYSEGNKWGFKDSVGNIVVKAKYDDLLSFSGGFAAIKLNNKWGFINGEGNEVVIPSKYDMVGSYSEGRAYVRQNDKCGFIDENGVEVISPAKYNGAGDFYEELAMVCFGNLYGFINKQGEVIIDFKYDFVWDFDRGLAKVHKNKSYGFVDKTGNEIIPIKYDKISNFKDGVALAKKENAWVFINKNEKEILGLDYQFVWDVDDGGYYKVFKNNKYGYINNSAKEVILLKYDYIGDFKHGFAHVQVGDKTAIIDRIGREINNAELVSTKPFFEEEMIEQLVTSSEDINSVDKLEIEMQGVFVDDRDNQEYEWQRIGKQVWMMDNLSYQAEGSKCFNSNGISDCEKFGRYYAWELAANSCPAGWKLPSENEWELLINRLGGNSQAYKKLKLGGQSYLDLMLGGYIYKNSSFEEVGDYGYYWTSTASNDNEVVCIWMNSFEETILTFNIDKNQLRNVRCIKE